MANGMRQILLLLIPAAAAVLVLSEPITRLVYQRGSSMPPRPIWSLRRSSGSRSPCPSTAFPAAPHANLLQLAATVGAHRDLRHQPRGYRIVALALYAPFGVGGIVVGTVVATLASVAAQATILRRQLGGLELTRLVDGAIRVTAAAALLAGVSYLVWDLLDEALGRGTAAQIACSGRR